MKISVASGKGGTGKTLVATSLALALEGREPVRLLDCDVEEPNSHIFLKPKWEGRENVAIPVPVVDKASCTYCGACAEACAFNAIAVFGEYVMTFPELCHGCGACAYVCPANAIREEGRECGVVEWGKAGQIEFVRGTLNTGEAMAPPVIRRVKKRMDIDGTAIIDAPPGTSCPAVESIRGTDFCLLVTEPTLFGLNDLKLAVETVKEIGIPSGVVLNRAGDRDGLITDYCREENLPLLMRIPLDIRIARLYSQGTTLVQGMPEWKESFLELYGKIREAAG